MLRKTRWIPLLGLATVVTVYVIGMSDRACGGPETAATAAVPAFRYRPTLLVQMRVADLDRAVGFYRDLLGFEVRLRSDALQWAEMTFGIPGVAIGLGAGAEVKGSGSVSLNLGVEDVDAARKALEARGVVFIGETVTVPDKVKLAELADPDGNRIRLAQSLALKPNADGTGDAEK